MSFCLYVRTHWEYLLSVALLLASSGAACWAAVIGRLSLVGPAVLLAFIAFICAMWCAEADAWRRVKEEAAFRAALAAVAARRKQRAEDLDG